MVRAILLERAILPHVKHRVPKVIKSLSVLLGMVHHIETKVKAGVLWDLLMVQDGTCGVWSSFTNGSQSHMVWSLVGMKMKDMSARLYWRMKSSQLGGRNWYLVRVGQCDAVRLIPSYGLSSG